MKIFFLLLTLPVLVNAADRIVTERDAWRGWAGISSPNVVQINTHYQCGDYTVQDSMEKLDVNGVERKVIRIDSFDNSVIEYIADNGMVLKTSLERAYLKVGNGYLKCEIVVDE